MNLKHLLKTAIQTVWKTPYLWLFGFFAAIFVSNEVSLIIINFRRINDWINNLITLKVIQTQFQQVLSTLGTFDPVNPRALFNLTLAIIVIFLFFWMAFLSQIALIRSAKKLKNKTPGELLEKSREFIWPVVGVNLGALLITYGLLALLGLPFLYRTSIPIIGFIVLFLLVGIFISFVTRFILCFIILEEEKFIKAIKKGALFFLKNWWIAVKTSVSLFLMAIVVGLGFFLVGIGASTPFLVLTSFFFRLNFLMGFWIILVLWTVLLAALLLAVGSAFSAFQYLAWASLFRSLRKAEVDKM